MRMPSLVTTLSSDVSTPVRPETASFRHVESIPDSRPFHSAESDYIRNSFHPATPPSETDVAIIGNGPSAICLSYFLSGNWPFYNGETHPNETLQWHLSEIDPSLSLVEQDLAFLSEGLEGRSSNPVAVLFDALTSPNADLGDEYPACVDFRHIPDNAIPHAVFGKGAPGGSWNTIESSLLTVSAGSWMELPGTDFESWRRKSDEKFEHGNRVKVGDVSAYYLDYVRENDLEKNFYSYTKVTSVKKVNPCSDLVDSETGEEEICPKCSTYHSQKSHWEIKSTNFNYFSNGSTVEEERITKAKFVVLATGSHDDPRKLKVEGEDEYSYVMHSFRELEDAIMGGFFMSPTLSKKVKRKISRHNPLGQLESISSDVAKLSREQNSNEVEDSANREGKPRQKNNHICDSLQPLMVVGAGLTAADAITIARSKRIPVIHVFRCKCNNASLVFHNLPPALFPEYHKVFSMMNGIPDPESGGCLQCYTAFQGYTVSQFLEGGEVVISDRETETEKTIKCGGVLVCAGARPILDFLENEGRNLGTSEKDEIIDSSKNPVEIDTITYESTKETNLFAMGPLVGDNFVRYLRGGALGITNSIWNSSYKSVIDRISQLDS